MGTLRERGMPFIETRTTFALAYPTVERAIARFTETDFGDNPVWSKISNALKMLGFRSHNFLAQLLSQTARACTIRVRRSTLGRLWNDLGSHAGLHHRNRRPGTSTEKRISGRREPDPESPNPRPVVVIRCRKSYVGGYRPPAGTESLGRIGGGRETGYPAGLVPKAHRHQVRRIEVSQIPGSSQS